MVTGIRHKAVLVLGCVLLAVAIVAFAACAVGSSEAEPVHQEERIDLSDHPKAARSSPVQASVGNRIELRVLVKQEPDQYRRCAEPFVLDAYGNVFASLSPVKEGTSNGTQETTYMYDFYAPTAGEYTVELDNHECSVALVDANVIVTWTVHER